MRVIRIIVWNWGPGAAAIVQVGSVVTIRRWIAFYTQTEPETIWFTRTNAKRLNTFVETTSAYEDAWRRREQGDKQPEPRVYEHHYASDK